MATKHSMNITSPVFTDSGSIPSKYTCDGSNTPPPLDFEGVPAEAKSLVLIMDDPDVPWEVLPEGVFDHWVVYNIPPKTGGFKETDTILPGTYGVNSIGQTAYTGPCPPDGAHRYFFRLYALDIQLALKKGASKTEVLAAIEGYVIAQAELMGTYERTKTA